MNFAEHCLIRILSSYCNKCMAEDGARPLPSSLDDMAYAILILIETYGHTFEAKNTIRDLLIECESILDDGDPWSNTSDPASFRLVEKAPFSVARGLLLGGTEETESILEFGRLLSNQVSEVRYQAYQIGWLIRDRLLKEYIANILLTNVSFRSDHITEATSLALALFETEEAFDVFLNQFSPPAAFHDQFYDRIKTIREEDLAWLHRYRFLPLELRGRYVIESFILPFPIPTADVNAGSLIH